ncbi:MAG: hypothetical protein ACTSPN_06845 [Promethearchaeota archaeon]
MSEIRERENVSVRSKSAQRNIQIVGGAVFGAVSIALTGILMNLINLTRIQGWGIAFFDPMSWIWMICFLLFGPLAGILSSVIGTFGLLIFDPTGIGSIFKFSATIPQIILPTLLLKLRNTGISNKDKLKNLKKYILVSLISIGARIGIMLIANITYLMILGVPIEYIELFGITGWMAVTIFVIIINSYAGALDLGIAYLVVYSSKLDEKFELW